MWLCKRMRAENVLVAILKSLLATQLTVHNKDTIDSQKFVEPTFEKCVGSNSQESPRYSIYFVK